MTVTPCTTLRVDPTLKLEALETIEGVYGLTFSAAVTMLLKSVVRRGELPRELLETGDRGGMLFCDLELIKGELEGELPGETRRCPCGEGAVRVEVEDGGGGLRVDVRCPRCDADWDFRTRRADGVPVGAGSLWLRRVH